MALFPLLFSLACSFFAHDFNHIGYGGPCPPPGNPHRYFFRLYALDTKLQLEAGATKQERARAMEGHILAEGHLMGTYACRASQAAVY